MAQGAAGRRFGGCGCGRRSFLAGAVAAGLAGPGALAATAPIPAPKGGRIDVHHHYFPKAQREAQALYSPTTAPPPAWSTERSLEQMDGAGVGLAVLSIQLPGAWMGGVAESRRIARACNDEGAGIVRDHPGRFGLFAALPFPDAEGSLAEIDHAFDMLKADGIGLMTSYDGKYLGDPAFTPVLEALNRRKAVCFVHPTLAPCCVNLVPGVDANTIEYATDTTRTIASLLFNRAAERFADIRFIFSHSGGTFPYLTARFVRQGAGKQPGVADWPLSTARRFYYEIAQGHTAAQLAAIAQLVPPSQLLFGSDAPFRPIAEAVEGLAHYPFTRPQLQALQRDTALALMPGLGRTTA